MTKVAPWTLGSLCLLPTAPASLTLSQKSGESFLLVILVLLVTIVISYTIFSLSSSVTKFNTGADNLPSAGFLMYSTKTAVAQLNLTRLSNWWEKKMLENVFCNFDKYRWLVSSQWAAKKLNRRLFWLVSKISLVSFHPRSKFSILIRSTDFVNQCCLVHVSNMLLLDLDRSSGIITFYFSQIQSMKMVTGT